MPSFTAKLYVHRASTQIYLRTLREESEENLLRKARERDDWDTLELCVRNGNSKVLKVIKGTTAEWMQWFFGPE